jgi:hypothetical protein
LEQRKIDYPREAKRKSITPCGANRRVGGMKLILAVRPRKIDYRREAKRKSISPWGVNRRQAEWNRFLPWGKEKSIITVRQRKNRYRHEAWIAVRQMKSILAMRQRKIDYRREVKKNWLSPWGEEKNDYRREAWIAVRRNEIDSCREAKKKNQLSPWGEEKIDIAARRRKWNQLPPWGKEKVDHCVEAKKKSTSPWGANRRVGLRWGDERDPPDVARMVWSELHTLWCDQNCTKSKRVIGIAHSLVRAPA